MASSSFTDAPNADSFDPENKSVTIVINDNGEINYDEKTLQSIIDSNQQSATVTFVRVSGDGAGQDDSSTTAENMPLDALDLNPEGSGDPKANPILMLDQEQINRLENVLSSDEAKSFLGEVLANPDNNPNQSLGDILTSTGQTNVSNLTTNPEFALIGPPPPLIPNSEMLDNSLTSSSTSNTKKNNANRRKSQRQIDRELKEEAERIRKENQEILKKEKEAMKKDAKGVVEIKITPKAPAVTSTTTPSGRPKRERKLPAHLKDGDFAISSKALGLNADSETATGKKKPTKNSVAEPNQASSALEIPDEITDEILGESPKNVEDDAMEDQEPKDGEDKALFDSDSDDDDDDDMNSEEADSEDDPNKLWCICQQPHNNRFMICCDSCLDWYHGKCVGITKKMGKEMEEAGNEWSCPKCKTKEEKENTAQLKDKMKERAQNSSSTSTPKVKEQQTSSSATTTPTKKQPGNKSNLPKKSTKRRSMSKDKEISGVNEPKKEEKKCFVCDKIPKEGSIYCSDDCITKHANKAIELLKKTKPKGQTDLKRPVLVTDPLSNAMLQGPSAPTEATLHSWLLSHPTFHVVLPKSSPSSKFYSTTTSKFYGSKKLTHKHEAPTKVSSEKVKAALQIQNAPKPSLSGIGNTSQTKVLTASLEKPETPSPTKKSPVTPDKKFQQHEPEKKMSAPRRSSENVGVGVSDQEKIRKVSGSDRLTKSHVVHSSSSSSSSSSRRDSSSTSATVTGSGGSSSLSKSNSKQDVHRSRKSSISSASPKLDVDKKKDKVVRDMTTKGFKDALKLKLAKQDDNEGNEIKMEDDKLEELVKAIEKEMYLLYNRDAGTKYKAKYRSLVFNIKDEKNLGFFRKIINGNISPKVLVAMSPEQMASKELKEWRQSELKNDIEKIKSHELDLLKMGSKIVLKTHKGEEVKEAPNTIKNTESVLPDEIEKSDPKKSGKEKYKIKGANTWDHGKLETCMTKETKDCDVCSGKMTEDAFLVAKIEREKRHKERERDKKRHKSHKSSKHKDHHKSDRKDRDRHHRDRKDRDKEKRSSSDDKKKSSPKDQDPAKKIENKEPEVRPEDIEKKVEEILASSGASEMAKIRESSQKQKQFDEEIEILQDDVNEPGDIDIPALTQAEQNVPGSPDPEVLKESEVTSTVTIKTPEETLIGSTNPSVWNGEIDMPEVARFSVTAHQVSGTTDYLTYDLNEKIRIAGRIPPTTVWDYIKQVSESPTKEILLISLLPTSKDERMSYLSFYNYLKTRDRFGVVRGLGKMVKDCYVIALPKEKEIHPVMLPLDGPGLDADRDDLLLALIVRSKRKRSNDGTPIYQSIHPKVSKKTEVEKTAAAIVNLDKNPTYNPTPVDKLYDPDDDEVYDPESAFVEDKSSRPSSSSKISKKRSRDEPAFSSDESPSPPPPKAPVTSTSGFGAADSTKKETPKKKVEDTKAEPMAGFKGLPTGIASILFGSSTSSTASTTTSTVTTTATGSTESRDPRKKPTPSTENKNTSAAAKIAQPNKKPESSNKSSKTSVLGSLSDADLLAMIPDSEKSSDVKVVQEISSKNSTKSNSSTNIPKPIINVDSQQPKPSPKIFELSSDDSSPLRPAPSGGAYPPAPPAIRQELTAPKSSSAQGQSPGPWMQGMDPQNQPNLPWPTSTGSSSTSTTSRSRSTEKDQQFDRRDRRSSRDDYNRGRDYDRGHHHRVGGGGDRRDYDRGYDRGGGGGHRRDYDRRYSRDDRDHRERDYDRNRGDRYRDRDYDRDRDRGGYYRRESRDDRGGGGRDDRGGDRYDHDRGGSRDDHDRTHDHEQKKIEDDGKSTKEVVVTEENKVATEEFLSSFSFGEPKPPGEDSDVVPF